MDSAEAYARARALFLEASRLPSGERTRFLSARCGADAALAGQVRRLLAQDEEDDAFLESPVAPAFPASPSSSPGIGPGARLGAFRIIRLLGEGGMGVVYEAHEEEPDRRVALKLIRPGHFSERLRARFRHEIRVLGQLRHPGVAQIYEAGTLTHADEVIPFFAMELVEGEPLTKWAERLGVRERLAMIAQICDAVHHAHQKGVIHRDLKPGNILVDEAPTGAVGQETATSVPFQIKILDFGVARAIDTEIAATSMHTQAGQVIGTLAYMSPEQAAGDADALDIRSDVYSIGVIAFELLIGRLPYEVRGKPLGEAARIIGEQEAARLGQHDRSLRGDVETIVAKALEKDRKLRYQSAAEVAADIRRHLRDEPIVARPASALYQARKFARRHKPLVIAAALVVLAMGAATAISIWQARAALRAQAFAELERTRADRAAAAAAREATRATLEGVAAAIASGDPITATRLLDGAHDRGWAWRYWKARLDESVAMVRVPGGIAAALMSAEGNDVSVLSGEGAIYHASMWSGELKETARLAEVPLRFGAFYDAGRRIITDGPDRRVLTVFDAADGRLIRHLEPIEASLGLLKVSSDGGVILAGPRRPGRSPADVLWLFKGDETKGWSGARVAMPRGTSCAAMTPDGRWLALGKGNDSVMIWDTSEPEPRDLEPLGRGTQAVAISTDASLIATGGVDKTIAVWNRATGNLVHSLSGHSGSVTALAFDPTGRTLASAGTDLTIRLWDIERGQAEATLIGLESPADHLEFNAGGSLLLSASRDGSIRLWRPDPFEGACILRGHSSYVYAVAFTPDGSRILSGAWDGKICAWDAASGRAVGEATSKRGSITALAASPDGRIVATGHKKDVTTARCTIVLWDARSLSPQGELGGEAGEISDLIFSSDASRLYASSEAVGVDEFDLNATPAARRRLIEGEGARSLALPPDGRRLACGRADGSILLVDVASGQVTRRLEGHKPNTWVRGVAFHPTRPILASACDDGTARLWDLATGRSVALRGHTDKVYAVAFSPDGRVLATGSEDTTIALWGIRDDDLGADELTRLRGHDAYVYSLAFSPDGTRLISGSGDQTVRVWDTRPLYERCRTR